MGGNGTKTAGWRQQTFRQNFTEALRQLKHTHTLSCPFDLSSVSSTVGLRMQQHNARAL